MHELEGALSARARAARGCAPTARTRPSCATRARARLGALGAVSTEDALRTLYARYGGVERRVTRARFRRLCSDARVVDARPGRGAVLSGDIDVIIARAFAAT